MSLAANEDLIAAATRLTRLGRIESATTLLRAGARNSSDEAILRALLEHSRRFHDREALREAAYRLSILDGKERDLSDEDTAPTLVASIDDNSATSVALPRIAGVMDEFTTASYAPECIYLPLDPSIALEQIEHFKPCFVFVESAWHGSGGLWSRIVSTTAPALREMLSYCRENGIPTVFWNKEDPVHFSTFLETARLCDFVFTTDFDCIPAYKQALGHDLVYLLPFAAQPRVHNPIATVERRDAFNFAGSYYLRYPQRQRDFSAIIDAVSEFGRVEIHDRNYGKDHPHYTFPDSYKPLIVGNLPFSEIERAYKGYRYGINMNTIKRSQTMFARRVFELLASNTIVVSNFSRGVRTMFGDLVLCSDDSSQIKERLTPLTNDEAYYRKFRLLGLRKVLQEHCYGARLRYILSKIEGSTITPHEPQVALLSNVGDADAAARVLEAYTRQSYHNRQLFILAPQSVPRKNMDGVEWFSGVQELVTKVLSQRDSIDYFGILHADDYYGPNYLTDLILSRHYCDAQGIGKVCQFENLDSEIVLKGQEHRYRPVTSLPLRASLVRSVHMTAIRLAEIVGDPNEAVFEHKGLLSLDEFNYCRDGAGHAEGERAAADLELPFQGIRLTRLYESAERLNAAPRRTRQALTPHITVADMAADTGTTHQLRPSVEDTLFCLDSSLPPGGHAYVWLRTLRKRQHLNLIEQNLVHFSISHSSESAALVCEFYAGSDRKVSHTILGHSGSHVLAIPEECTHIRFGFRVAGPGRVKVGDITCGTDMFLPPVIVGRSSTLVLAKQYPSQEDIYRYGFLHTRVRSYLRSGVDVDVFRFNSDADHVFREYENVDVASGDADILHATLATGHHRHVLVHILDRPMWEILKQHLDAVRVTVWIHGSEAQDWKRRAYEFRGMSSFEVERQKTLSEGRMLLWNEVFSCGHSNLRFVFVSSTFYAEVVEDVGVTPPVGKFDIIHNYIDGDIFRYAEKPPGQRMMIASVRSYDSMKYANDLTVNAILDLANKPIFGNLQFLLIGDGALHDTLTGPLAGYSNVRIHKGFMSHSSIAEVQKNYGVFLTPTRWDSQGVSRDEAMSCGLVPITSRVAAVPEFVDESCGFLAAEDDHLGLAAAIERLYHEPALFQRLSRAASLRVRMQSGFAQTIGKELAIINVASEQVEPSV